MKKTLSKIALVICLFVSAQAFTPDRLNIKMPVIVFQEKTNAQESHHHAPLWGLNREENLKSYHVGLSRLMPSHLFPSVKEMEQSIDSHPLFCGSHTKEEAATLAKGSIYPYLIFRDKASCCNRFYVLHKKEMHLLTVQPVSCGKKVLGSSDNLANVNYPTLSYFLKCFTI